MKVFVIIFSHVENSQQDENNCDKIEEKDVLKKILQTLLNWFGYVVTAIEESKILKHPRS